MLSLVDVPLTIDRKMTIHKTSLIDVLSRIHIFKEKVPTVERKPLRLVLPYLGTMSLQTRTKLQKSIKGVLNCCKLQVIFKSQNKLCNNFHFKDPNSCIRCGL